MATFILVPGWWLGAWAWQDVTRPLRDAGHDVHPVTLTGVGDRVHLARPETDLGTHITDVVNTIRYADLHDVILVGHSGGGIVAAGVADRIPERLSHVVYVDSGPLPDGMAQLDLRSPEQRQAIEKQVGDGHLLPPPAWDDPGDPMLAGLGEGELALMRSRATPQPYGTATEPQRRGGPSIVPETLVTCTFPEDEVRRQVAAAHPYFAGLAADPQIIGLPTGHWPMFSRPADLTRILAGLAAD